ncbi:hypothetical protein [Bacillus cereus]|uniref:Uncharacterized protein n=1 Tax=Bacillus cereus TaxID=1396 RepID=A0A9X7M155_BACCE|nr:hypothetical protein [Bacillus cereus]MDA2637888.1 hypothetical protein [Bacillus cereus]QDZ76622.1 hypothetical protein D0437_27665 [Bacillus cereus]
MVRGTEYVLANAILCQIELQLEQVIDQALVSKENETVFRENRKAFVLVAENSRNLFNCLQIVSKERTLEVAQILEKMEQTLEEIEAEIQKKESMSTQI